MGNCFRSPKKVMINGEKSMVMSNTAAASSPNLFPSLNQSSTPKTSSSTTAVSNEGQILEASNLRIYTLAELKRATGNFDPRGLIGEGEFTKVFKGWVDEKTLKPAMCGCGLPVAVKRCQLQSMQAFQKWLSEVKFLGSLSHPNVVKLLGFCRNDRELLLVYEFMALGNLETCLFGRGAALKPLSWSTRLKIAIAAARGLAFIHTSKNQVIYRDIKTSNILLGSGYIAKLSDFGLARNGPADATHVTTQLKGNFAYAAPEYAATGHLYVKSDVYGFGVMLLEMLLGRQAYDENRPSGEQYLVEWAKPFLADNKILARVVDPRLDGRYSSKGAFRLGQLILWCLDHDWKKRPSMHVVVHTLELIEAINMVKGSRNSSNQPSSPIPVQDAKVAVPHRLPLPPTYDVLGQVVQGLTTLQK